MAQTPLVVVTLALFCAILCCGGVSATTTTISDESGDRVNGVGAWGVEKHFLEELGKYAVACHNLDSHHQLTFQKVISCDHLPNLSHKLTIAAGDGGITKTYEAVVCYKPLVQFKKLISFKLA